MRATLLIALIALLPTALAVEPVFETWQGRASSHMFYAGLRTLCYDEGDATLIVEREMESATFTVLVQAACVPTMTLRAVLTHDGWRFEEPTDTLQGTFTPTDSGAWRLHARADTCPPGVICEFTSGVHIDGIFEGPLSVL